MKKAKKVKKENKAKKKKSNRFVKGGHSLFSVFVPFEIANEIPGTNEVAKAKEIEKLIVLGYKSYCKKQAKKVKFAPVSLSNLNNDLRRIVEKRCGENVFADGLVCPHCAAFEAYKSIDDPDNVEKWVFAIKGFKVGDRSHCTNCDKWF